MKVIYFMIKGMFKMVALFVVAPILFPIMLLEFLSVAGGRTLERDQYTHFKVLNFIIEL